jgi:nitronate monooxygenase
MNPGEATRRLRELIGTRWPIVQAPMAGVQGHALAAAAGAAGALGSLPGAMLSPAALAAEVRAACALGDWPLNLNFFCHATPAADRARDTAWRAALAPYLAEAGLPNPDEAPAAAARRPFDDEACALVEALRPRVVSFHFGLPPTALLARVKAAGAAVLASATSVEEARWLEAQGVDAVIAQGTEAGGHRGHFLPTSRLDTQPGLFALLPQVVRAVCLPVLAAGGVMDAAGVRAAFALGAAGVQCGSAFLRCPEATTPAMHRAALASARVHETALTHLFTGRPARGIVNRLMRELGPLSPAAPPFPTAGARLAPLRVWAEAAGRDDFTPLWAGQHAAAALEAPAAAVVAELVRGLPSDEG